MKKNLLTALVILIIAVAAVLCVNSFPPAQNYAENDYLRIHVRANSNSADDQKVKYEVKDEIVAFITPYITRCVTKEAAIDCMNGILPEIESVCERALAERGYYYGARANVRKESFPTRVYGDVTLEAGEYDALIVELGTGKGDNWWCVVYPPLCFTSSTADFGYRSLVADIIRRFFAKG